MTKRGQVNKKFSGVANIRQPREFLGDNSEKSHVLRDLIRGVRIVGNRKSSARQIEDAQGAPCISDGPLGIFVVAQTPATTKCSSASKWQGICIGGTGWQNQKVRSFM
jgi:hypothetical protein